ncbi:hypothetical protein [Sediminispirochaeta smaragdinae]|uniref:Lipoprotein n=1 Tax=Sediminispirochaeta smaragdinae (strain DSM 11293 / JCM 15392 / SEBR 4228) TaxID=573413 RepID=E1R338_SEDSS|nr:hypothetical protein [Sediminispirochaeta smaragdinae]ADK81224.1 hypothetical protein Spirs_2104 [Sediminispirochaeta smaragdinae DSM 11293]
MSKLSKFIKGSVLTILTVFLLFSCDLGGSDDDDQSVQKTWTISGTIDFSGCSSEDEPDIKFAAFFVGDGFSSDYQIVSNVVNLGNSTTAEDDVPFSLSIDASSLSPEDMDEIVLALWQDTDDDDLYDESVDPWSARGTVDCPIFGDYTCYMEYYDYDGYVAWLIDAEYDYIEITSSNHTFTGAVLEDNRYIW